MSENIEIVALGALIAIVLAVPGRSRPALAQAALICRCRHMGAVARPPLFFVRPFSRCEIVREWAKRRPRSMKRAFKDAGRIQRALLALGYRHEPDRGGWTIVVKLDRDKTITEVIKHFGGDPKQETDRAHVKRTLQILME
jgi:hypothetical protein